MNHQQGLATLNSRKNFAIYALWAFIVADLLLIGSELLLLGDSQSTAIAGIIGLAAIIYLVVFIATVVLVSMWIHRAHANLRDNGVQGLEFTPGWAVGWYFVPFANLFKPFQAMRELFNRSHGEDDGYASETPGSVKAWWAFWIIGNILANVSTRMSFTGDEGVNSAAIIVGALATLISVGAAWLLMGLIKSITTAQASGSATTDIFT